MKSIAIVGAVGSGLLVVLIVVGLVASGGSKKSTTTLSQNFVNGFNKGVNDATHSSTTEASATALAKLYPGRVDSQPKDHEATVGQAVDFLGYTTSVDSAAFQQSVSDYQKDGYILGNVTIKNRDAKAQSYSSSDFRLQTPEGQVLNEQFPTTDGSELRYGDLVQGGTVSGKVGFTAGSTKGDYYIIYKPNSFDASRGIWRITVK